MVLPALFDAAIALLFALTCPILCNLFEDNTCIIIWVAGVLLLVIDV